MERRLYQSQQQTLDNSNSMHMETREMHNSLEYVANALTKKTSLFPNHKAAFHNGRSAEVRMRTIIYLPQLNVERAHNSENGFQVETDNDNTNASCRESNRHCTRHLFKKKNIYRIRRYMYALGSAVSELQFFHYCLPL
jgi:hypothetical protein